MDYIMRKFNKAKTFSFKHPWQRRWCRTGGGHIPESDITGWLQPASVVERLPCFSSLKKNKAVLSLPGKRK